jgi:hypothetical protein
MNANNQADIVGEINCRLLCPVSNSNQGSGEAAACTLLAVLDKAIIRSLRQGHTHDRPMYSGLQYKTSTKCRLKK